MTRHLPVRRVAAFLTVVVLMAIAWSYVSRSVNHRSANPIKELDASLVGHDYRFYLRYPGDDRILGNEDDRFGTRDLYVPQHANVQLRLSSRDYIYTVEIPELDVYEAAVPDLSFTVRFAVDRTGSHDLLGSQMCGYDHPDLIGKLIVQPSAEFERTMQELSKAPLQTPTGD